MIDTNEILKIVLPGLLGGGAVVAYFKFRSDRPINVAKANQINATVTVSYAKGWQEIAQDLERRMNKMEHTYEEQLRRKDGIIDGLNTRITRLEAILRANNITFETSDN